jgi:hypothetical protein
LSSDERKQHLPGDGQPGGAAGAAARGANGDSSGSGNPAAEPKTPSPKGSAVAAAAAAAGGSGAAAAAAAAAGADRGEEAEAPKRKLLLLWFHTNSFEWRMEDEVLPFITHKQEFKGMCCAYTAAVCQQVLFQPGWALCHSAT